ncbi:MAG: hypothetical protein ABIO33_03445 [Leifsonia sp.]
MRWSRHWGSDEGSASLEFITIGLILLVPLVYLVLALSALQSGALAAEGAARQAARVFVLAPDEAAARERVQRAVEVGLDDYGVETGTAQIGIACSAAPLTCLTRQERVTVTVRIRVALPLVPDFLALQNVVSVPMEAQATQTVSRFWGAE